MIHEEKGVKCLLGGIARQQTMAGNMYNDENSKTLLGAAWY